MRDGAKRSVKRRRVVCFPKQPKNAELILKESWEVDASGKKDVPLPCIVVVANRQGYWYLARYFEAMANRKAHLFNDAAADPDDHVHFNSRPWEGFDPRLSDLVTFRLGTLDKRNRPAVFERYGITRENAERGDMFERYTRRMEKMRQSEPVSTIVGYGHF